jgi:hypothetical protein
MSISSSINIVGCDAVNSYINKPIPGTLWHYTSHAGFQGIISSKKIWASEFRFLNDRQEFFHTKELAVKLIDEEPESTGEAFPARDTLRSAVNIVFNSGYLNAERLRIMVASFSEEGDLLSQWRGYADNSRGVSIGFDLRGLRPPSEVRTTVTFAPCLYSQTDKSALLKTVFGHYRDRLQDWWDSIVKNARKESHAGTNPNPEFIRQVIAAHQKELDATIAYCHANLQFDFLRIAPLLKDESFCEEKEWRLVLPWEYIFLPRRDTIEFRPTRDTLVPYIAYPLNMPGQEGPVFCKDVILGPGCHPSAAIGVNLFLQKQEISVLARPSQIPYRPTAS